MGQQLSFKDEPVGYASPARMGSPKYPLASLVWLRDQEVERAANELAGRVQTSEAAERARRAVERKRDLHEESAARVHAAEDEALARGSLRAADLARADAWKTRAGLESRALATELGRERASEQEARKNELDAQADLATRQAAAQVVAKDQARWGEGQRRKAEARDEEASSEAWRPKA
jgi:hypothetical protein